VKTHPIAGGFEVTAALRQGGLHPDAKAPIVAFVATRRGLGHGGGHCGIEKSF